jgi:methylmalonyl-CoA/ethylmalonyl-CoA epimerase
MASIAIRDFPRCVGPPTMQDCKDGCRGAPRPRELPPVNQTTRSTRVPSDARAPAVVQWRAHHFGISVPDLDAAIDWYCRMLGFELEKRLAIPQIPAELAFIRRGDFRVEIFQVEGAASLPPARRVPNQDLLTHGNKHMCFEVPDVPAAVRRLRELGADIAFETIVEGNPTAFVRDVAGNLIEFLQPFPETPGTP